MKYESFGHGLITFIIFIKAVAYTSLFSRQQIAFFSSFPHSSFLPFLMYNIIRTSWHEYSRIKVKAWLKSQVQRVAKKEELLYLLSRRKTTYFLLMNSLHIVDNAKLSAMKLIVTENVLQYETYLTNRQLTFATTRL